MLPIVVPAREWFDEATEEFKKTKEQSLQLEHSLVSLSRWESKWKKPFLNDKEEKTQEEMRDYIRCMTITQNVDPMIYEGLDQSIMDKIQAYIDDPMTATTFSKMAEKAGTGREVVTSELIYYWMICHGIPDRFEKWHLNRLLTLIRICNIKNSPGKKMTSNEVIRKYANLNAQRRKALGSRG